MIKVYAPKGAHYIGNSLFLCFPFTFVVRAPKFSIGNIRFLFCILKFKKGKVMLCSHWILDHKNFNHWARKNYFWYNENFRSFWIGNKILVFLADYNIQPYTFICTMFVISAGIIRANEFIQSNGKWKKDSLLQAIKMCGWHSRVNC